LFFSPVCVLVGFFLWPPMLTRIFRNLLKKLKDADTKASFYVIGSRVIERPNILIEEYMSGHEIGVHTWSHPVSCFRLAIVLFALPVLNQSLTSLTNEQIVAELGWTRRAIRAVLGVTPITMRPPKGDIGWSAFLLVLWNY